MMMMVDCGRNDADDDDDDDDDDDRAVASPSLQVDMLIIFPQIFPVFITSLILSQFFPSFLVHPKLEKH